MENNNINNTDVNITEEVQEKKEDLKIIKLKPSQLEILKEYKTHKKDSYYDLFERLVNNKDELQKVVDKQFKKSDITRYNESIKSYINKITVLSEDIERAAQDFVDTGLEEYYKELDKVAAEIVETVELKDEVNKLNELLKNYQKEIETHKEEIDKYKADIIDKDKQIADGVEYAKELLNSNELLEKEKVQQGKEHTDALLEKDRIIESKNDTINENIKLLDEKTNEIITLNKKISDLGIELSTSKNNVKVIEAEKDQIQKQVEQYKDQVENLKDQNTSLNSNIENLNATKDTLIKTNKEQNDEIKGLLDTVSTKDSEIRTLKSDIVEKDENIKELNSQVSTLNENIEGLNGQISTLNGQIETLGKDVESKELEIESLKKQLDESAAALAAKGREIDKLEKEKNDLVANHKKEIEDKYISKEQHEALINKANELQKKLNKIEKK